MAFTQCGHSFTFTLKRERQGKDSFCRQREAESKYQEACSVIKFHSNSRALEGSLH